MLFHKYLKPLYAAEVEAGTDVGTPPPTDTRIPDGPGSGRGVLRKQLEDGFEKSRVEEKDRPDPIAESKERTSKGQFKKGSSNRMEQRLQETEGTEAEEPEIDEGLEEPIEAEAAPQLAAPKAWTKEAKAEWAKLPATVQAAIVKRETDSQKGVEQLQSQYAQIDEALRSRMETIRAHGHTPGQAINQLFSWFEALSQDQTRIKNGQGAVAFQALAQSFGLDPKQIFGGAVTQEQTEAESSGEQPEGKVTPAVQQYIGRLEQQISKLTDAVGQKFGVLENTWANQQQARTQEVVNSWSRDKPHYEEVRQMMAHLLASQAIPLKEDGSADLDAAYDRAIYAVPEVRAKVLAEQRLKAVEARKAKAEAERLAQQEQADKARRAGAGIGSGAPPSEINSNKKGGRKVKSVGESLRDSIEELRG